MASNWSDLNIDTLEVIVEKMDSLTDYQRFRAVCFGWRSLLPYKPRRLKQPPLPCLLVPPKEISTSECRSTRHRSLLEHLGGDVVDHLELPDVLPRAQEDFTFKGFSKGWLVAVEKEGPAIYLINTSPTDEVQLRLLPPVNTLPDVLEYRPEKLGAELVIRRGFCDNRETLSYKHLFNFFVRKVVLSSSPIRENCIAMAVYGERSKLAYCKYGDKKWTDAAEGMFGGFDDIIFHKDKGYAVNYLGDVIVLTFHSDSESSPTEQLIAAPVNIFKRKYFLTMYLVVVEYSSGNQLLIVGRKIDFPYKHIYETTEFEVFNPNLDWDDSKQNNWSGSKLERLDNQILFLGYNESLSFSSHNQGNVIYYSDDYFEGHNEKNEKRGSDFGAFDMEENAVYEYEIPSQIFWPPPIWVMR